MKASAWTTSRSSSDAIAAPYSVPSRSVSPTPGPIARACCCIARRARSDESTSTRARARISACSVTELVRGSMGAVARVRRRASARRSIVNGCERSQGYWLLSFKRVAVSRRSNIAAMPEGE